MDGIGRRFAQVIVPVVKHSRGGMADVIREDGRYGFHNGKDIMFL